MKEGRRGMQVDERERVVLDGDEVARELAGDAGGAGRG